MSKRISENVILGDWFVGLDVDSDGHLTVSIKNYDGSPLHEVDEDFLDDETEITRRFTTDKVETDFQWELSGRCTQC